jgi:antitoxin ParD1/3/4
MRHENVNSQRSILHAAITACYMICMTITLTAEQLAWINAHVAEGDFPSVEAAARQLIDERIAERSVEDDDFAWAKPLVDEALAEIERGEIVTLEEHDARIDAFVASIKR